MNKELKQSKILHILNNRTQNSFFIDVKQKDFEVNKIILLKLYNEKLLDIFLDDYFNYRVKANNYNKIGEYLISLEAYIHLFSKNVFESENIFFNDDNMKNLYVQIKEKLKFAINNYKSQV